MALLDEAMDVLHDIDNLQKEYSCIEDSNASLRASLAASEMKMQVVENRCSELEKERKRLLELHEDRVKATELQYDFREKYEALLLSSSKEVEELKRDAERAAMAHRTEMKALREAESGARALQESEIESLRKQCLEQELLVRSLRQDIEAAQRDMLEAKKEKEEVHSKEHSRYEAELRRLQGNVRSLEQAKTKMQEELRKAEHEALTARMKFEEQLRDSGSNRHVEIFKQKVMQLRRENEDLKRRLQNGLR